MFSIVYETTNIINGMTYTGVHTTELLSDIYSDGYLGSGKLLRRAIKKNGKESFDRKILLLCQDDDFTYLIEGQMVTQEQVDNPNNYNLTVGGNKPPSHKGLKKVFTEEHKRNISKARIGMKLSEEAKSKGAASRTGQKRSLETRRKMSEAQLGEKHPNHRPIELDGNVFHTRRQAAEAYGVHVTTIDYWIRNHKHGFRYLERNISQ